MAKVELVYDPGCPHVTEARSQLLHAFAHAKLQPRWREWQSDDADSPEHIRGYGSPTILVDGKDVAGGGPSAAACCRLYVQANGTRRGAPSAEAIRAALEAAHRGTSAASRDRGGWGATLATLPAVGAALLPKVACPACWPAYAGFLSSLGLGFLVETTYLLPLTATFLAMALFMLAFRARRRNGYRPFAVGVLASALLLVGKFVFESDPAMYGGIALLVAASLWNSWPRKPEAPSCPSCVSRETTMQPSR